MLQSTYLLRRRCWPCAPPGASPCPAAWLVAICSSLEIELANLEGSISAATAGNCSTGHFDAWWEGGWRCGQGVTRRGAAVTLRKLRGTRCGRSNFAESCLRHVGTSRRPPRRPLHTHLPLDLPLSGASSSCFNTSPIHRAPSSPATTPAPLSAQTPHPLHPRPILADTRSDVRHVALPPTCPVPPARTGRSTRGTTPMMR